MLFFQFRVGFFTLAKIFMFWGCDVSVSSGLIPFLPTAYLMLLDAVVYGLDRGS
jgi:hypothetical protein